jgi:hypothetical protein
VSVNVHIRPGALEEIARSAGMRAALHEAGEAIAENVRAQGIRVEHIPGDIELPVEVDDDGSVTLAHPSGQAVQAKDGALTKAAAQAGLDVRGGSL